MNKNMQELNYDYFMQTDVSEFIGEWIAICDNEIVAHGKEINQVVKIATKNSRGKKFLLARVPSGETMIF